MENLKVLQKKEAQERLNKLVSLKDVRNSFSKDNHIWLLERQSRMFDAVAYDITLNARSGDDEYQTLLDVISKFETKYNCLVYLVQLTHLTYGNQYSLFYVSEHIEEWELDRLNIANNEALVYVVNNNDWEDDCNEFGYIGFKKSYMGGIVRTS